MHSKPGYKTDRQLFFSIINASRGIAVEDQAQTIRIVASPLLFHLFRDGEGGRGGGVRRWCSWETVETDDGLAKVQLTLFPSYYTKWSGNKARVQRTCIPFSSF